MATAAAKAYSNSRINIQGTVSARGKAAVKVNALSKANGSSDRKVAVVKKTNAGTKASVKVAEGKKTSSTVKSKKVYGTPEKTVASRYKVEMETLRTGVFKPKATMVAIPPITKPTQRKTNPLAHAPSAASVTVAEKSVDNVKSMLKQSPPFKSAVGGISVSAPEKLRMRPTNGYKQVHN